MKKINISKKDALIYGGAAIMVIAIVLAVYFLLKKNKEKTNKDTSRNIPENEKPNDTYTGTEVSDISATDNGYLVLAINIRNELQGINITHDLTPYKKLLSLSSYGISRVAYWYYEKYKISLRADIANDWFSFSLTKDSKAVYASLMGKL